MEFLESLNKPVFTQEQIITTGLDGAFEFGKEDKMKREKSKELILPPNPTMQDFQEYVCQMISERGFEKEGPKEVFLLLTEEWGELARAMRQAEGLKMADDTSRAKVSEELADCFIYLLDLANKYNVNLEEAFRAKEEKNKRREWK